MMTKKHLVIVGQALTDLPISARLMVYHRLCQNLGNTIHGFDPNKFGETMNIPPLMRRKQVVQHQQSRNQR